MFLSRGGEFDQKLSAEEVKGVLEIIASTGKFWYVFIPNLWLHIYLLCESVIWDLDYTPICLRYVDHFVIFQFCAHSLNCRFCLVWHVILKQSIFYRFCFTHMCVLSINICIHTFTSIYAYIIIHRYTSSYMHTNKLISHFITSLPLQWLLSRRSSGALNLCKCNLSTLPLI